MAAYAFCNGTMRAFCNGTMRAFCNGTMRWRRRHARLSPASYARTSSTRCRTPEARSCLCISNAQLIRTMRNALVKETEQAVKHAALEQRGQGRVGGARGQGRGRGAVAAAGPGPVDRLDDSDGAGAVVAHMAARACSFHASEEELLVGARSAKRRFQACMGAAG